MSAAPEPDGSFIVLMVFYYIQKKRGICTCHLSRLLGLALPSHQG